MNNTQNLRPHDKLTRLATRFQGAVKLRRM